MKKYGLFTLRSVFISWVSMVFFVLPASAITLSNTVNVSAISNSYPDNSDTVTVQVNTEADLVISKTDSPDPVSAGQNLTYNIEVTNNGPSNAVDIVINDTLPSGVTFVSATPGSGGSCTAPAVGATGAVSCTFSGDTAPAAIRTLTLVVKIDSGLANGSTINNTATTSSATSDPVASNSAASATTTSVPQALPVSSLNVIGLLLLVLIMLVTVTLNMRNPHRK